MLFGEKQIPFPPSWVGKLVDNFKESRMSFYPGLRPGLFSGRPSGD